MGERSPEPADDGGRRKARIAFSRAGLGVVLSLVAVAAGLAAFGAARLRGGPDLGRLVYIDRGRGVVLRSLAAGGERIAAAWPDDAAAPVLDAERGVLAYRTDEGVVTLDLDAGTRVLRTRRNGRPLGFDPAGRLVLARTTRVDGEVLVLDGDDERSILPSGAVAVAGEPVWLSDTRYAIAAFRFERPRQVMLVVDTGGDRPRTVGDIVGGWPLLASPDGTELLYSAPAGGDERLRILRLADGRSRDAGPRGAFRAARLGRSRVAALLATGRDAGVWTYDPVAERGRRASDAHATALAWSWAGSDLLYVDARGVWALADGRGSPARIVDRAAAGFLGVVAGR